MQYVSVFDPSFREKIRGATPSEIATLESLSPIPLPDYYKDFLLQMGRGMGGLRLPWDADWDIVNLIEYYRDHNPLPPGYIVIAVNGAGHCGWEICLQIHPAVLS